MSLGRCSRITALGVALLAWVAPPSLPLRGQAQQRAMNTAASTRHPQRGGNTGSTSAVPLGFSPRSFAIEQNWEEQYLKIPDPAKCGKYLRRLTAQPHVAGTGGDHLVTQFIFDEFERDGLEPEVVEYRVLL